MVDRHQHGWKLLYGDQGSCKIFAALIIQLIWLLAAWKITAVNMKCSVRHVFNPITLSEAKIVYNFGLSGDNSVKASYFLNVAKNIVLVAYSV